MDFTVNTYKILLNTLKRLEFSFITFEEFISIQPVRTIILRHDVDRLPGNSLEFAKMLE